MTAYASKDAVSMFAMNFPVGPRRRLGPVRSGTGGSPSVRSVCDPDGSVVKIIALSYCPVTGVNRGRIQGLVRRLRPPARGPEIRLPEGEETPVPRTHPLGLLSAQALPG